MAFEFHYVDKADHLFRAFVLNYSLTRYVDGLLGRKRDVVGSACEIFVPSSVEGLQFESFNGWKVAQNHIHGHRLLNLNLLHRVSFSFPLIVSLLQIGFILNE